MADAALGEGLLSLGRETEHLQLVLSNALSGSPSDDEELIGHDGVLWVGALVSFPCPNDDGQLTHLEHVRNLHERVALHGLSWDALWVIQNAKRDGRVKRHVIAVSVLHLHEDDSGMLDEVHVEVVTFRYRSLLIRSTVAPTHSDRERERLVVF